MTVDKFKIEISVMVDKGQVWADMDRRSDVDGEERLLYVMDVINDKAYCLVIRGRRPGVTAAVAIGRMRTGVRGFYCLGIEETNALMPLIEKWTVIAASRLADVSRKGEGAKPAGLAPVHGDSIQSHNPDSCIEARCTCGNGVIVVNPLPGKAHKLHCGKCGDKFIAHGTHDGRSARIVKVGTDPNLCLDIEA
jgi:hypothetical protein